jgi:hypothetical protein
VTGDTRGQAIGIARLFLALGVGAVVIWIVNLVASPLFDHAESTGATGTAAQGTAWLQQGTAWLPIGFALISFFGLVAYSVFARGVLR